MSSPLRQPGKVDLADLIAREYQRQSQSIQLIASENLPSPDVVRVLGHTLLASKTAEGSIGQRYQGGCEVIDAIEQRAIDAARALFNADYVNVQPMTATAANLAVFRAVAEAFPATGVLAMDVACGGHISHARASKHVHSYSVNRETGLLDYDEIRRLAGKLRPKLIVAGASAYSRAIDFAEFRRIADASGSLLLADVAHTAGLIAAGLHPSPISHAHVTTASTYKTLRGPRSAIIMSGCDSQILCGGRPLRARIDKALFPGLQSSPNLVLIAAKAACFESSNGAAFRAYARRTIDNARVLADSLASFGFEIVTGGTDNHIVLVDLRKHGMTGCVAERALEQVGIMANRNLIPFDKRGPRLTSGLRLGTPFVTSRGFDHVAMASVAHCVGEALTAVRVESDRRYRMSAGTVRRIGRRVGLLAERYPLPAYLNSP